MNLHRSLGAADWEQVPAGSRNYFQNVAAATHGILTPANVISVLGFGLVIYGLIEIINDRLWLGIGLVVVGRLLDIADGAVADRTGTKSPLGEKVDAVIDKAGTLLTIIVLFMLEIIQPWLIIALAAPQILTALVVAYKKHQGIGIHPTRAGKLSMALVWVSIGGVLVMAATQSAGIITGLTFAAIFASLGLGLYALFQYATGRDQT